MSFSKDNFIKEIQGIASASNGSTLSRNVAELLDERDQLAPLRDGYILPTMKDANVVETSGECSCC